MRRPVPRPYPPRRTYARAEGYAFAGSPYGSSVWLTPWELGFPDDDSGYDAGDDGGPSVAQTYVSAPPDEMEPTETGNDAQWQSPEPGFADEAVSQAAPEDMVTLIFKDGRAPQLIRNYMLTKTTLTIADGRRLREVPIADLDLAATEAANAKVGVAFNLPQ